MADIDELFQRVATTRAAMMDAQRAHDRAADALYRALREAARPAPAKAKPTKYGAAWTPGDETELLRRWRETLDVDAVARAMSRSRGAIFKRLERLGVIAPLATRGSERATC